MRKSVLALGIMVIILLGLAVFYYSNLVSASHFSNDNVSFDYPNSFSLTKTPVAAENSNGTFVCALSSPDHNSAIVIYQIPLNTTKNVTSNQTGNSTSNNTTNIMSSGNNSTNNTTVRTNQTIQVNVNNLQDYLDQLSIRGGSPQKVVKNNYTYYVSGNLKTALVNYNSSSRTGNITLNNINETAIVKDGFANFYVIELINGSNNSEASNAYTLVVNSLRITVN